MCFRVFFLLFLFVRLSTLFHVFGFRPAPFVLLQLGFPSQLELAHVVRDIGLVRILLEAREVQLKGWSLVNVSRQMHENYFWVNFYSR